MIYSEFIIYKNVVLWLQKLYIKFSVITNVELLLIGSFAHVLFADQVFLYLKTNERFCLFSPQILLWNHLLSFQRKLQGFTAIFASKSPR